MDRWRHVCLISAASLRGEEVDIYRLPGFRYRFQRDDVLVFEFPLSGWERQPSDLI